jgi:hypothetical protein
MFAYLSSYRVLICVEHQYAVYSVDEHLKRYYGLLAVERRQLLAAYTNLTLSTPEQVTLPPQDSSPIPQLGSPQDAFLCCQSQAQAPRSSNSSSSSSSSSSRRCGYITTNRKEMRKHVN